MTTTQQTLSDPFVSKTAEDANTTISAEDMIALLDSLKLDSSDVELQALLTAAKNGQPVEREKLMTVVTSLLSDNQHLGELAGSIGDFDIQFT